MKFAKWFCVCVVMASFCLAGCSKPASGPAANSGASQPSKPVVEEHGHGTGPNGGVVFDLGSHHAEFTVDHNQQQCTILFLGADEKTPFPITATGFVLSIKETKTADGKVVAPMTVNMQPVDAADGKAAKFTGTDPGIGNVADFAGTVSGEIDSKPAMGEFAE